MKRKNSYSERVNKQLDKLEVNMKEMYQNPEMFCNWLRFNLNFHQYSNLNRSLIYFANPEAKYTASYNQWLKLGFPVVRKGAITILAPKMCEKFQDADKKWKLVSKATEEEKKLIKEKKVPIRSFVYDYHPVNVFDVSSTDATEADLMRLVDAKKVDYEAEEILRILKEEYDIENDSFSPSVHDRLYEVIKEITSDKWREWRIDEKDALLFHEALIYVVLEYMNLETSLFQFHALNHIHYEQDIDTLNQLSNDILDCAQKMLMELSRII